jgi:hypothetical protein
MQFNTYLANGFLMGERPAFHGRGLVEAAFPRQVIPAGGNSLRQGSPVG